MIPVPDIGHVYPKGDVDLRFDSTPTYTSAGSCYFDGDSGKVTVSAASGINGLFASGGTVTAWVRAASDGEGNYGRVFDSSSSGPKFFTQGESGGKTELVFIHPWDGDDGNWKTSSTSLAVGVWSHVAVTYNGSGTGNDPLIYVNGESFALTESGSGPSGTVNGDTDDKVIGNQADESRTFHGSIANFGMWKGTILTQAQIRKVMTATSYAAVQAVVQPTAYYLFSANGNDSTGNFNGTLA